MIKESQVILVVYDLLGRHVETLVDERLKTGVYSIQWDAKNHASGTYLYQIVAKDFIHTKKMTFLK